MIYQPKEDSYLVQKFIKRYASGPVLDMGTGSGILAKEAFNYTKNVTAVDINKEVIDYLKQTSDKNIKVIQSDLFLNIKDKYKLILFNPPYLPEAHHEDYSTRLITTGGKHGYELIDRFFNDVNNFLTDDGKILMVFSSLTNKDKVDEIVCKSLFQATLLESKMLPMFEQLYLYLLEKTPVLKTLKGIDRLRFLTKGHRGYIYTGYLNKKKVTIKLKNPASKASGRIKNEVKYLKLLNKEGIGPKLIKTTDDYFIYEYIDGDFFPNYIKLATKDQIKKVIIDLFEQLYTMDKMKINKEEMHHPYKHIIVNMSSKPVLIDFERAGQSAKPHNITQFCQYLCSMKPELKKRGVFVNMTKLRDLSRDYKKSYNKKILDSIISSIL